MFEQIILLESRSARRRWALAGAFVGELLLVGIVIAIPLLSIQKLPLPEISTVLIAPPPPPPPPGPAAQAHAEAQAARVPSVPMLRHFDASKLSAPRTIPTTTATIDDLPTAPLAGGVVGGVAGGVPGGQVGGVLGGILGGVPSAAPPPPPPPVQAVAPPPTPATPKVLRVGGAVEAARVISAAPPAYPVLAKSARIEGTVRMNAVIGPDGHIENLSVVSGNPLLINAAVDAVKQWTYRPTYLNGQAVKVQTEINVKFELTS